MEIIDLHQAIRALERRRLPDIHDALGELRCIDVSAKTAIVLEHFKPGMYAELTRSGLPLVDEARVELWEAAIQAAGEVIPLSWSMDDQPANYEGGPLYIEIEPQSIPFSYDEWDDLFNSIDELDPSWSLTFFMKCMDSMADREIWEQAAEHFGWPEMEPSWFSKPVGRLDSERLFRRLKGIGLAPFVACWKMVWHDTGNYYLDYDDELNYDIPEFTLENVQLLQAEWADAEGILKEWNRAREMVEADPGVLPKVLAIFERSLSVTEELHRARTLMELFGGRFQDEPYPADDDH